METQTPWWRFVLSITFFVLSLALLPPIITFLQELFNLVFPAYRFTGIGLLIFSRSYGVYISISFTDSFLNEKHPMLIVVISVIAAIYFVFVSSFNLAIGVVTFWEFVSFLIAAVVAIVQAFKYKSKIPNK